MGAIRGLIGGLFLLAAIGLTVGVLLFGVGGNAVMQQLYLLGAISCGVIAVAVQLSALEGVSGQIQDIYIALDEVRKNQKKADG